MKTKTKTKMTCPIGAILEMLGEYNIDRMKLGQKAYLSENYEYLRGHLYCEVNAFVKREKLTELKQTKLVDVDKPVEFIYDLFGMPVTCILNPSKKSGVTRLKFRCPVSGRELSLSRMRQHRVKYETKQAKKIECWLSTARMWYREMYRQGHDMASIQASMPRQLRLVWEDLQIKTPKGRELKWDMREAYGRKDYSTWSVK